MTHIYIIIDNKQAVYLTAGQYLAKENYFDKIISDIYDISYKIYLKYNITTNIQWCKGHIWSGNNIADKLANEAVDENINNGTSDTTPISISTTKNIIKKLISNQEQQKLKETKEKHIISKILIDWNIFEEYKEINIDIEILSKLNLSILTQLRTGHIKFNFCMHQLNHMEFYKQENNIDKIFDCDNKCCQDNNNGYCIFCNKTETVYHFIMDCKNYSQQRDILYYSNMKVLYTNLILM